MPLDGCVGKLVAGFSWQYAGVCSAKQAEKLLGADGKPLRTAVEISFPGQSDAALRATVSEVTIDAEKDVARFVLQCNSINGDVLCLNHARARISTGESTGLRVPAAAVHYLKEDGTEAETQGENYIPACTSSTATSPVSARSTGGCRPSADLGRRLHPCFAQGNGRFCQSGKAL